MIPIPQDAPRIPRIIARLGYASRAYTFAHHEARKSDPDEGGG
jgi:hypothetical protein